MATIIGDNSAEYLPGTANRDIIDGRGGDDTIDGFGGNDDLYGGSGDDVIYGGAGDDDLYGGSGVNDLFGGSGFDWFIMSGRANSSSDDWIGDFQFDIDSIDVSSWGVSDFSQLKALLRTDSTGSAWLNAAYNGYSHYLTIDGVAATELISSDFIYSNAGARNETGTAFIDTLFGSRYADVLSGGGAADILLGGIGADVLNGDGGADHLIGGAGADILRGGAGADSLTGNAGADVFDFNAVSESPAGAGRDIITDLTLDVDVIDVHGIDARSDIAGNQDFRWIGAADFTAAGQLNYYYAGGNTIISGNTDADAQAEFQVAVIGRFIPIASDFVL